MIFSFFLLTQAKTCRLNPTNKLLFGQFQSTVGKIIVNKKTYGLLYFWHSQGILLISGEESGPMLFLQRQREVNQLQVSGAGPNLDKKCIRLSDAAPSHEIIRKIYFAAKPLIKGLNRGCWNFKYPFLCKKCHFC